MRTNEPTLIYSNVNGTELSLEIFRSCTTNLLM